MPFTSRRQFEGHAVRAMYAASGATDYYAETGDAAYWSTLERLWSDLANRQMYITGGVRSRQAGSQSARPTSFPTRRRTAKAVPP